MAPPRTQPPDAQPPAVQPNDAQAPAEPPAPAVVTPTEAEAAPEQDSVRFYDEHGGHVDVSSPVEITQYRFTRGYSETPPQVPDA